METKRSALIIVDVQNDFCPGGSLAVPHGDEVVAPLNRMVEFAIKNGWPILASRDWHPRKTSHFAEFGGKWPVHCVQETQGADFHPKLDLKKAAVVSKGINPDEDAYSAFDGYDDLSFSLWELIYWDIVTTVFIGGLATDYCVKATALDARRYGFETYLLLDACRAVNINSDDGEKAVKEMREAGVIMTSTDEVISEGK